MCFQSVYYWFNNHGTVCKHRKLASMTVNVDLATGESSAEVSSSASDNTSGTVTTQKRKKPKRTHKLEELFTKHHFDSYRDEYNATLQTMASTSDGSISKSTRMKLLKQMGLVKWEEASAEVKASIEALQEAERASLEAQKASEAASDATEVEMLEGEDLAS